jgi:hypothetical protein
MESFIVLGFVAFIAIGGAVYFTHFDKKPQKQK